jgi:trehalose 6-phosphate synthase
VSELVVAANRGPSTLVKQEETGAVVGVPGGGGLAPSLAAAIGQGETEAVWIAAAMNDLEREVAKSGVVAGGQEHLKLRFVDVAEGTYRAAYDTVANATLWFCFHGMFDAARRPLLDRRWREAWEAFRVYNAVFAEAIAEDASEAATVVVNDYHLPLVGRLLSDRRPDLATVHFTHTPFPTVTELAMLPRDVRRELVEGLSSFGATGFHTRRWEERFRAAAVANDVAADGLRTFAAPLGADERRLSEVVASKECEARLNELDELVGDRKLIVRSDRMELSKNVIRGFLALDELLEQRPKLRGGVCMVARSYPSRESLPEYLAYRSEVEHLAAVLNERWSARCGGRPPIVLAVDDNFAATVAAFRRYDVLLVNPIRDGMNLVAKEGPTVNERDGVLVVSEEAGAFEELGEACLGVQPFDVSDTAAALARALEMPEAERRRRSQVLRERSVAQPPSRWFAAVMAEARPNGAR